MKILTYVCYVYVKKYLIDEVKFAALKKLYMIAVEKDIIPR